MQLRQIHYHIPRMIVCKVLHTPVLYTAASTVYFNPPETTVHKYFCFSQKFENLLNKNMQVDVYIIFTNKFLDYFLIFPISNLVYKTSWKPFFFLRFQNEKKWVNYCLVKNGFNRHTCKYVQKTIIYSPWKKLFGFKCF